MTLCGILFEPFRDLPGWYTCADPSYQRAEWNDSTSESRLCGLAKELAAQAKSQDYRVFYGLFDDAQRSHQLFAIKAVHPCRLALDFRVGSHNQASDEAEEKEINAVYEQMMRIYEVRSFQPYFIDAAGYHCAFEGQITEAEAQRVDALLYHGAEWYASNWEEADSLVPIIVRENEVHLWWD